MEAEFDSCSTQNTFHQYLSAASRISHFLPFFFLAFPPSPAASGTFSLFAGIASISILCSVLGSVGSTPAPGTLGASMISPLTNLPRPVINLPTSADLFVSYFKHIPAVVSKVLMVSVAAGIWCSRPAVRLSAASEEAADCPVESPIKGFTLRLRGKEYLVVMRVVVGYA